MSSGHRVRIRKAQRPSEYARSASQGRENSFATANELFLTESLPLRRNLRRCYATAPHRAVLRYYPISMTSVRTIKRRLTPVLNSVSRLVEDKHFFQEYQSFLQSNTAIDKKSQFLPFIGINYIEAAALGIFRELDRNRKSQSLLNLLRDIEGNAGQFTYRRFAAKYSGFMRPMAQRDFQQFAVKDGSRIDRRKLKKDIAELKRVTRPVVKYRHKYVAHRNRRSIAGGLASLYSLVRARVLLGVASAALRPER